MELLKNRELTNQISRVWKLSVPAILTQITSIVMQYIDSAMVGKLGAGASAAIGLVSTSTWLLGGLTSAISVGFSVQVAQHIGAKEELRARQVVRHGLVTAIVFSGILLAISAAISGRLPVWLGGEAAIVRDASLYFLVFALSLPFIQLNSLAASCLQCSGNMVTPSVLNAIMCSLDVVFNAIFIPVYGVLGAAIGTALATVVISLLMLWFCCFRSDSLRLNRRESSPLDWEILKRALKIGTPVGGEQVAMCGAMVASTIIIAPLGTVAIAAHSFAITAESLCYMPGYGVGSAATTLVGQSMGAREYKQAKRYGNICVGFGAVLMGLTGIVMYFACPLVFRMLTPDLQVRELAAQVLRIGLLAEPLYAVSIAASGALRGAEDTLVPSILNLVSIWVVRLGLALMLVPAWGLHGMWVAMATELCVRGLLLLRRQLKSRFYHK
jgi:putative MATE family efflux protein